MGDARQVEENSCEVKYGYRPNRLHNRTNHPTLSNLEAFDPSAQAKHSFSEGFYQIYSGEKIQLTALIVGFSVTSQVCQFDDLEFQSNRPQSDQKQDLFIYCAHDSFLIIIPAFGLSEQDNMGNSRDLMEKPMEVNGSTTLNDCPQHSEENETRKLLIQEVSRRYVEDLKAQDGESDQDSFFVVDLGEVHRLHQSWTKSLGGVKPFYGMPLWGPHPYALSLIQYSFEMQLRPESLDTSGKAWDWVRLFMPFGDRASPGHWS